MPTLTQYEYLIAIDEFRHFGKAAKSCSVSQPSLSLQLQKLEEELRVTLFDRSKKPILPTDIGKKVILQARKVLQENQRIFDLATDETIKGNFHLAVIPTLTPYLLPLFIDDFSKTFPQVQLSITEMKTSDIIEALKNDRLDGALLATPLQDDQIIERTLFYEPFCLYHSDKHPLSKKTVVKTQDLKKYPAWFLEEGHCMRNQVLNLCQIYEGHNVLENVNFKSGNIETLLNLVNSRESITIIPELARLCLSRLEQKNRVKEFSRPTPTREISLICSRIFLKEKIIEGIEQIILKNIPSHLTSLKKTKLDVIPID